MKLKNKQGVKSVNLCVICNKEVPWYRGRPSLTCSKECFKKRISDKNKKIYQEKKPKVLLCKRCEKPIRRQGKKVANRRNKFCSKLCYDRNEYYRNHFKRHFDKAFRLQEKIIKIYIEQRI
tara:strand:- start:91 stop:453 length:363 start_codon:yes stop_codon:yes gene_type:complete